MFFSRRTNEEKAGQLQKEGLLLINEGKFERGIEKMAKALNFAPDDPLLNNNLGGLLFGSAFQAFKAGDRDNARVRFSEAAFLLEKASELLPPDKTIMRSNCFNLLGQIQFHAFDRVKAEEWYKKALATYADHPEVPVAFAHLEATRPIIWDTSIPVAERAAMLPAGECLIFPLPPDWTLAFDLVQDGLNQVEWTPKGETVADWSELLTASMEVTPDVGPMQWATILHESFSQRFQQVEVVEPVSRPLNGYDAVTVGFSFSDPFPDYAKQTKHIETKAHQFCLYKLIRGRDFFYQVQWEWRSDQIDEHPLRSDGALAHWQALLENIEICDTRVPGHERSRYMIDDDAAAELGPGMRVCVLPPIEERLASKIAKPLA